MSKANTMYDEIACVAYGLYEKRGCVNGNDFGDWVEAEKIVMKKFSKGTESGVQDTKTPQKMKIPEKIKSRNARVNF